MLNDNNILAAHNVTDITGMSDADLDALLGLDSEPTWAELVAESNALIAESRAMRIGYHDRRATNNGYKPRPR